MRLARIGSAPALVREDRWVDVPAASGGRFAHEDAVFADWDEFRDWAPTVDDSTAQPLAGGRLQAPRSTPRHIFGAGLNYHSHLAEANRPVPDMPPFFTKFPTCISGPTDDVVVATDAVDFQAELVVVLGRKADRVRPDEAWDYVAGLTVGQDISARDVQRSGQLSLGKSSRSFAPTGPWISTFDEVPDRDDIRFTCSINGETLQDGRTSDMVFEVPHLLVLLSAVTTLLPGDLVFTGTASGVGVFREPRRYLRPGDELHTEIDGLGVLDNRCVGLTDPTPEQRRWHQLHPVP